ncbi:glycosyltransferase [Synechococcus elongatus IITB7]|uniref:glycosyltransferase n=1 Tax=Synechococcus elongatus TaxID=32046 RepID=UPI0030D2FCEA
MNLLFIHQNFPGQWKHLAPAMATLPNYRAVALAMHDRPIHAPGVEVRRYRAKRSSTPNIHPWSVDFESQMIRGESCAEACIQLRNEGFVPDVICAHPGWGEALFLKDVWPRTKILGYHELHYQQDCSQFDREFATSFSWQETCRIRTKNAAFLLGYEDIDWGVTPTRFQWKTLPNRVQERTSIIHDGVDIKHVKPDPRSRLLIKSKNLTISRESEVITFVSRNLEPTRGFHRFMRALPQIQANHPNAHIFIVGKEGHGYGAPHPSGKSYKQVMLEELEGQLDLQRLHFLGPLPYNQLLKLLQLSTIHVYFTIPFVLSWSLMEAMACGALVIGSKTAPLEEVIQHGHNGLLVDYFQTTELVEAVKEIFQHPDRYERIRQAARQTIVEGYDLRYSLQRQQALIQALGCNTL